MGGGGTKWGGFTTVFFLASWGGFSEKKRGGGGVFGTSWGVFGTHQPLGPRAPKIFRTPPLASPEHTPIHPHPRHDLPLNTKVPLADHTHPHPYPQSIGMLVNNTVIASTATCITHPSSQPPTHPPTPLTAVGCMACARHAPSLGLDLCPHSLCATMSSDACPLTAHRRATFVALFCLSYLA